MFVRSSRKAIFTSELKESNKEKKRVKLFRTRDNFPSQNPNFRSTPDSVGDLLLVSSRFETLFFLYGVCFDSCFLAHILLACL